MRTDFISPGASDAVDTGHISLAPQWSNMAEFRGEWSIDNLSSGRLTWTSGHLCFERDNLRERERQSRAQMSLQGDDHQEAVPVFKPPVKITAANGDRVTQQIKSKLGDFNSFKQHLLDDPKTSIGVYGEPASPAPGGPPRGVEFKKPHHTTQNGRPPQRIHHGKIPDCLNLSNRVQPSKFYNGKTPPNVADHNGAPLIENILKEMKSLPTPLTAIASTPRKEIESFPFPDIQYQKPIQGLMHNDAKPNLHNKNHLDRHTNPRLSADLERDLRLTDSEDEARKRMHPQVAAQSRGASSSGSDSSPSDSESDSSSDDSKPNGTRTTVNSPAPEPEKSPEVVEGPGDTTAVHTQHRQSWSLVNFAPQTTGAPTITRPSPRNSGRSPSRNSKHSPRRSPKRSIKSSPRINNRASPRINRASPRNSNAIENKLNNITSTAPGSNTSSSSNASTNNAESDSCYDSTKEVESVLAEAKGKSEVLLLSSLSDSEAESGSDAVLPPTARSVLPNSSSERGSRIGSRPGARRSPRTPARPRPPSSPSASEDESLPRPPRPNPEKRKNRGRPPKSRPEEEAVKRKRGRPPKPKVNPPPVHPQPTSSDDENPPSSPSASQHWHQSDSEADFPSVATDKKKNDTLRKLFCPVGGAKGGGKGGGKGGKGKGQVMVIEAHTLEHKDDKEHARTNKEEDAYRRLREEDPQRKAKEDEAALNRQRQEEALQKKQKEDELKRQKEQEESIQKRIKEENMQKKRDEEMQRKRDEANQRRREEEAIQRRLKEEALRKKFLEDEMKRKREEEILLRQSKEEEMKRRRDEELARKEDARRLREEENQRKYKSEELMQRKIKDENLYLRRFKDDDRPPRSIKEEPLPQSLKDEDVLQRRIREDEEALQRQMFITEKPSLRVHINLGRLSSECTSRVIKLSNSRTLKRPPPPPATPPDKRPKMSRQNPETTPTNHERLESSENRNVNQNLVYYSYLERDGPDCSSDEESRDHKYYLSEATRLRTLADHETDLPRRLMLYQESVLCFVLTGRVLELELDTKRAFTVYRGTYDYIKSIHGMPNRCKASPFSTLTKLDILSFRCQALLCLRMFKMYKREVKESNKILQEYQQKQSTCPEAIGTVSPLSPTPSPAGSVGSVGSAGSTSSGSTSSGYGSCVPAATPQHTPGSTPATQVSSVTVPASVHSAQGFLVKYYTFLHMSHDLWDQADALIKDNRCTDLFISVDRACGPLTLHSTFRHLVKYVRHAIFLLKQQARHNT